MSHLDSTYKVDDISKKRKAKLPNRVASLTIECDSIWICGFVRYRSKDKAMKNFD